jgi:hypothetical protein
MQAPSKIVVIGGRGALGRKIIEALIPETSQTVAVASRRVGVSFDWLKPETFQNIAAFDIVINAAPVGNFEAYTKYVLSYIPKNKLFIETIANMDLIKNIMKIRGQIGGTYIHGAGVFPGVSNVLCKYWAQKLPKIDTLRLNMKYNVFSQAGTDMCLLMAKSLGEASISIQQHKIVEGRPIGHIHTFSCNNNRWKGFEAALPDSLYLQNILPNARYLSSYFSGVPSWLVPMLKLYNYIPQWAVVQKINYGIFLLLRTVLFSKKTSKLQLGIEIDGQHFEYIGFTDALLAAGLGVRALIECPIQKSGIFAIEEAVDATVFLKKLKACKPEHVFFSFQIK